MARKGAFSRATFVERTGPARKAGKGISHHCLSGPDLSRAIGARSGKPHTDGRRAVDHVQDLTEHRSTDGVSRIAKCPARVPDWKAKRKISEMSRKMSLEDFSAVRIVLEPDDFARTDGQPDPPPADLISEEVWQGITALPDDVAIRTSDRNGKLLGEVCFLFGKWGEAIGEVQDELFDPMLDAADDLQTSIFAALHGYYRAAFSALRNVLELVTIGTCGRLQSDNRRYANWRTGSEEYKFRQACNDLLDHPRLSDFNANMRAAGKLPLWHGDKQRFGYTIRMYKELCNYAHSRRGFTDADIRKSNGPIYVANAFWDWYFAYLRTLSLASIALFLARPEGDRSAFEQLFTDDRRF